MDLEWLYGLDELKSYTVNTKQGRERLDVFIKHLPNLLDTAGIHLPQKPRILCLMAGSCMEGIAYATVLQAKVTCLDVQAKMLTIGKKEAKRRSLDIQTVHSDAANLDKETKGPFDLVTIHGAPLPHIDIFTFDKIADKAERQSIRTEHF